MSIAAAHIVDGRGQRQILIIGQFHCAQEPAKIRQIAQLQVKKVFHVNSARWLSSHEQSEWRIEITLLNQRIYSLAFQIIFHIQQPPNQDRMPF